MFGLGPQELFIILLIALVLFGPKRLPDIARSIGKGLGNLNKATSSFTTQIKEAATEEVVEEAPQKKAKTAKPKASKA